MKVLRQDKNSTTFELSPLEILVLNKAMAKEVHLRRTIWENTNVAHPDEMMYHATMKETADVLKKNIGNTVAVYRDMGIIK